MDLVAVAEGNYLETFDRMVSLLPRGVTRARPEVLHLHSGARLAMMNPTFLRDVGGDAGALLDEAGEFHATNGSPGWAVVSRAPDEEAVAAAAAARGFTRGADLPLMALAGLPDGAPPEGLEVRRVADPEELRLHYEVLAGAFGIPFELIAAACDAALLAPGFRFFLGLLEGEPVASAMSSVTDTISETGGTRCAGVWNVGILPSFRGRGIGRAMTAHAAAQGREQGAVASVLQPSEAGYALYLRMGFEEVARWSIWVPPAR